MRIFSAEQLKEADLLTLKEQGISSTDLMERAATRIFRQILEDFGNSLGPIKIFCGLGNNGGDGLVLGRLFLQKGYEVHIYILNYSDIRSNDFFLNLDRIEQDLKHQPTYLNSTGNFPKVHPEDLIIDAIFGVGLSRPLQSWIVNLIKQLNRSGAPIIAVDVPSGMFTDQATLNRSAVIRASFTYTIQNPKLPFFLPDTGEFTGTLRVVDIGLDDKYLAGQQALAQLVDKSLIKSIYKKRGKFSHKGTFGHALIVGGSLGKVGSIILASKSSFRIGAGVVSIFAPNCGYSILQTAIPEAMVLLDQDEYNLSRIEFDLDPTVICFGVGAGKENKTLAAYEKLLKNTNRPMVLDADGLNLLSENQDLLREVPKNSVLTPHPKELERLIGTWSHDFEKIDKAKAFVRKYQVILVIKGAHSMIISDEAVFINTTGNPGMATAGSGDVLAGVITGLLSQGYEPLSAAVFGVYLHGKSGDIAARLMGYESMMAGDICNFIGAAYLDLLKQNTARKDLENYEQ